MTGQPGRARGRQFPEWARLLFTGTTREGAGATKSRPFWSGCTRDNPCGRGGDPQATRASRASAGQPKRARGRLRHGGVLSALLGTTQAGAGATSHPRQTANGAADNPGGRGGDSEC